MTLSLSQLMGRTRLSCPTVIDSLSRLEALGLVVSTTHERGKVKTYYVPDPPDPEAPVRLSAAVDSRRSHRQSRDGPREGARRPWTRIFSASSTTCCVPRRSRTLGGSAIKVYLVIGLYSDFGSGWAYPSIRTIAKQAA